MESETNTRKSPNLEIVNLLLLFFKLSGVVVVVWLWGYIGFSVSWLFIVLLAYILNEKYRRSKKIEIAVAQEVARDEKSSILSRITDLPSWVFFPDTEKAEWLNKIIKAMWPYIADYVRNLLKNVVEASIRNNLPDYLKSFRFAKIDLGDISPRIGSIKVYTGEYMRRDEILFDVEIYYYGDADLKVRIKSVTAGIKNLEIRGTVRISLRPLIPKVPFIGAMTVAFLNNPYINFNLTDFGNALEFPGLSDLLRGIVQESIAGMLVLPNRLPIALVNDVDIQRLRYPLPQGLIRIRVFGANDLEKKDIGFGGKSDPYCVVKLGAASFKTKTMKKTVDPEWNETFEAVADQRSGQVVEFELFDSDAGNKDDFLGRTEVDVETISKKGKLDTWLHLEDVKSGTLHMNVTWYNLSPSPGAFAEAEEEAKKSEELLSCGLFQVVLDSAKDLPFSKRSEEPQPYAVIQVANSSFESQVKTSTQNPIWEEAFNFLISSPYVDTLTVVIRDKKSDKDLGSYTMMLKMLLSEPNMTMNRPFALKQCQTQGYVTLRMSLRAFALRKPDEALDFLDGLVEGAEDNFEENFNHATTGTNVGDSSGFGMESELRSTHLSPNQMSPARSSSGASSELRRRAPGSTNDLETGIHQYGRLQLTLRYSSHRLCLVVVVHKACHLIACDDDGSSDPYVKLFIVPKSSHTKKKTQVIRKSLNPTFDETFELPLTATDVQSSTLRLEMRNHVGRFSRIRKHMGVVELELGQYDLSQAVTSWLDLRPTDGHGSQDHSSLGSTN